MVSLSNYQNAVSGMNFGSDAEVAALSKALEAGYQVGAGKTGGSALRVESLEASLKVLTYNSNHIKLWKKIPKSPAYSTVEEYNQLSSYGGEQMPFVMEGESPQDTDSSYARKQELVKFMGTRRQVTHQATLFHPAHGDVVAQENTNGILWLLQQVEKFLFSGNASLAFNGVSQQWNGLDTLIDSTSIIDMKGLSFTEADIEEGTNTIVDNYGWATDLFLGNRQVSDLTKTMYPRERFAMPSPVNGVVGNSIGGIQTQAGLIDLNPDIFIKQAPTAPAAATSSNAPATPASIAAGGGTGTTGDHTKGAPAGNSSFAYVVTACNRFGESAPTAVGSIATLSQANKDAGQYFPLTITNAASLGAFAPEYFRIYRSRARTSTTVPTAMTDYSLIAQVPATSQTASATGATYNDLNLYLPFTSSAYLGELTPSVLTFRQLLPMMKLDLAVVGPAFQWLIMLYGTPILFAPKKWLRYINVGNADIVR
jgi:hypothetical protein